MIEHIRDGCWTLLIGVNDQAVDNPILWQVEFLIDALHAGIGGYLPDILDVRFTVVIAGLVLRVDDHRGTVLRGQ